MDLDQGERAFRRLSGKVAIVTEGSRGIGAFIARELAAEGAALLVCGLPGDPVENLVSNLRANGAQAHSYFGDLSDELVANDCVDRATDLYGRLDVLANSARVSLFGDFAADDPFALFNRRADPSARAALLMTKYALPHLRESRGNIVSLAHRGASTWMHSFMSEVAQDQFKHGVRANCVSMAMGAQSASANFREDVAKAFAYLASDESAGISGAMVALQAGGPRLAGLMRVESDT